MFATIITPVDGTLEAERALEYAIALMHLNGAKLRIVWVIPRPEPIHAHPHGGPTPLVCVYRNEEIEREEERARAYMEDLATRYDLGASTAKIVRVGDLAHQAKILAADCKRPLLVLAAHHGRTGAGAQEQNVAQQLVAEATMPVLTIPIHEEFPADHAVKDHHPQAPAALL